MEEQKAKRKVIYSYPELLEQAIAAFEAGNLAFLGVHTKRDLVEFLYQQFDIRNLRDVNEKLKETTLYSKFYDYINLNSME